MTECVMCSHLHVPRQSPRDKDIAHDDPDSRLRSFTVSHQRVDDIRKINHLTLQKWYAGERVHDRSRQRAQYR